MQRVGSLREIGRRSPSHATSRATVAATAAVQYGLELPTITPAVMTAPCSNASALQRFGAVRKAGARGLDGEGALCCDCLDTCTHNERKKHYYSTHQQLQQEV